MRNHIAEIPVMIRALGTLSVGDYYVVVTEMAYGEGAQLYCVGPKREAQIVQPDIGGFRQKREEHLSPTTAVMKVTDRVES